MALTKKDKENFGQIVEVKVVTEIGLLRLEMNQRFDEAKEDNEKDHQKILNKIEEIKIMRTERLLRRKLLAMTAR